MGKEEPPKIIDAEFEIVSEPPRPLPVQYAIRWRVIVARVFCLAILALAAWDILSDGVPTRAGRAWLEARDTTWLDNVGYVFNFARNGELPPPSASEPSR